jgi:hypothetical protein
MRKTLVRETGCKDNHVRAEPRVRPFKTGLFLLLTRRLISSPGDLLSPRVPIVASIMFITSTAKLDL